MDGDRDVSIDKEQDDDNVLDQDYMSQGIPGEIKYNSEDNTEESEPSDSKHWWNKSKLSLNPYEVLLIPEDIAELSGLPI